MPGRCHEGEPGAEVVRPCPRPVDVGECGTCNVRPPTARAWPLDRLDRERQALLTAMAGTGHPDSGPVGRAIKPAGQIATDYRCSTLEHVRSSSCGK
jgi:hypothetical protein